MTGSRAVTARESGDATDVPGVEQVSRTAGRGVMSRVFVAPTGRPGIARGEASAASATPGAGLHELSSPEGATRGTHGSPLRGYGFPLVRLPGVPLRSTPGYSRTPRWGDKHRVPMPCPGPVPPGPSLTRPPR